jgi:ribosomal protein S18 acetylase RimI-like enzyme
MKIVRATEKDFSIIEAIQKNDGYKHSYYLTKKRYEILLQRNEYFYLLKNDEDQAIGFASLVVDIRSLVHFFSIHKKYQRKNAGTFLLGELLTKLKAMSIFLKLAYIIVEKDSEAMTKFLNKNGFVEAGFHQDRFGKNRDGVIFNYYLGD